jgi:hypothetical protein
MAIRRSGSRRAIVYAEHTESSIGHRLGRVTVKPEVKQMQDYFLLGDNSTRTSRRGCYA